MINRITGAGAGFFFWLFAARFYTPADVGLATAIIAAMNLLVLFSVLGFNFAIIAYLPTEKDKKGMINSCFTIIGLFSLLLSLLFISGINFWSPALAIIKENTTFLILFVLFTVAASLSFLQSNVFVAVREAKYSFIQSLVAITRIAILPFLIILSVFGIYLSYGLGIIMALIIGNFLILKVLPVYKPIPAIKKRIINKMMHFSFGNYIASIFEGLPGIVLPLLIINMLGAEMTAYFFIAWAFSGLLLMVPSGTSLSLFAEGSYNPDEIERNARRSIKFLFLLLIPAIVGIFLFGKYILLIFGEEYVNNAFEMMLILALATIPFSVNALYISIKRAQKEIMPVIYIYGFVALFTIVGGYVLLGWMGLIGIGIAWLLANGVIALGVVRKIWWKLGESKRIKGAYEP
ncbi:hypothetical protein C5S29_02070 [ANME-1 cluster archaeon GoMg3.2]|nr:hypothetical protein [ANME-1 cluster archaeon GoMg3.2]